jgi:metallophosphoesterase superfamily enzyme
MPLKISSDQDGVVLSISANGSGKSARKERHEIEAFSMFIDQVEILHGRGNAVIYIAETRNPADGEVVLTLRVARKGLAHVHGLPVNPKGPRGMYKIAVLKE